MKYPFTTIFILVSLSFILSACGRRGTLEKPSEEGVYPRSYPAQESFEKADTASDTNNTKQ